MSLKLRIIDVEHIDNPLDKIFYTDNQNECDSYNRLIDTMLDYKFDDNSLHEHILRFIKE